MKYHDLSPKVRSMIHLLVVGIIGAILSIILVKTVPSSDNDQDRFIRPLLPMLLGGTALTLFTTFIFGVVSLATESESKSRRWLVGIMVITLIIAYLFLFNSFGGGTVD